MTFEPKGDVAARVIDEIASDKPHYERHVITSDEQWHALRAQDVTGSVAAALFGKHPYKTARGLWELKSGKVSAQEEVTGAMKRGTKLEKIGVEELRERQPDWHIEYPVGAYYRDPIARLGCTPDVIATVDGEVAVVQIKSVEPNVFRQLWRNEFGEVECPLWIAVQTLVEAELTGATKAYVAVLLIGHEIDLPIIEIPMVASVITKLKEATVDFWRRVDAGDPPPWDYGRDGALIFDQLRVAKAGTSIDLSGDNRLPEIAAEDAKLASLIKDCTDRRKEIKAEIVAKLGDASVGLIDGRVFVTAKTVHRKAYQVAAQQYRDVRFTKRQKEGDHE